MQVVFSEQIINHSDVAFTSGCGGSKYSQITREIKIARGFDWRTVFSRTWIPTDESSIMTLGFDANKANVINKRNAEFLYLKELSIEYIKRIIFRSPADLKHAISILGENKIFEINSMKFNNHQNFLYDYMIEYKENCLLIDLIFHTEYHHYSHILKITYEDGFSELLDISVPNERIVEKKKPYELAKYNYYFAIVPLKNRTTVKMEYLMNGYVSALWEDNKNDKIL